MYLLTLHAIDKIRCLLHNLSTQDRSRRLELGHSPDGRERLIIFPHRYFVLCFFQNRHVIIAVLLDVTDRYAVKVILGFLDGASHNRVDALHLTLDVGVALSVTQFREW